MSRKESVTNIPLNSITHCLTLPWIQSNKSGPDSLQNYTRYGDLTIFFFPFCMISRNFFFLKGLNRGVPFKCLPLDFMGFYAIIGMEMDKTIKDVTKRYMVNDVLARKDAIKTMTYSSSKRCSHGSGTQSRGEIVGFGAS